MKYPVRYLDTSGINQLQVSNKLSYRIKTYSGSTASSQTGLEIEIQHEEKKKKMRKKIRH